MAAEPALFRFDPEIEAAVPHCPIVEGPTPVERLTRFLDPKAGVDLWVKRDDLTNPRYGGNKPRKLEFLLADAKRRGAKSLITFGVVGSHHGLATAIFGREQGLETLCILVNGPLHPHAEENLRRTCMVAQRTIYLDALRAPAVALALARRYVFDPARPYLVVPGGSSPVGNLGYVSAALELAEQVAAGEMPEPDYIFVPAGSLGTMTGLVLGLSLAGLDTKVIGVDIIGRPYTSHSKIVRATKRLWRLLREVSPQVRRHRGELGRFGLLRGQRGEGYGIETEAGRIALERMAETEQLSLDRTYTAKTAAAIQEFAKRPFNRGKTVLYWHTLSSAPTPDDLTEMPPSRLPAPLRGRIAAA